MNSLYEAEINTLKNNYQELKQLLRAAEDKNDSLVRENANFKDLIEKATVANSDLHTAFCSVREENLKLQAIESQNRQQPQRQQICEQPSNNQQAVEVLQNEYATLNYESLFWLQKKDELNQRVRYLEREIERYERDNKTLGKQVRYLLRTLEEERGYIIRREEPNNRNPNDPSTASDLIDEHLVTFKSIEELQQQNEKLLSLVKHLSDESRESKVESEDVKRLNGEVEALKSQLEAVKKDREQIMTALNTINKEKDLFKILLCKTRQVEHLTPEIFQRMVSIACASAPAIGSGNETSPDLERHLNDLKAQNEKLERELKRLQSDMEAERIMHNREVKLKTELLEEAHRKVLKEEQKATVLEERNLLLEQNVKSLSDEFEEARVKAQKLIFEIEQVTKERDELKDAQLMTLKLSFRIEQLTKEKEELQEAQAKAQRLAFQIEQLTAERDELQEAQGEAQRFISEIEQISKERDVLREALGEAQRFVSEFEQVTKERDELRDAQGRTQGLISEIERVTRERDQIKMDLEEERNKRRVEIASLASESQQKNDERIQQVITQSQQINERNKTMQAEIARLRGDLTEFQRLRNVEREMRLQILSQIRAPIKGDMKPSYDPSKLRRSFTPEARGPDSNSATHQQFHQETRQEVQQDIHHVHQPETRQEPQMIADHEIQMDTCQEIQPNTHDIIQPEIRQGPEMETHHVLQQEPQLASHHEPRPETRHEPRPETRHEPQQESRHEPQPESRHEPQPETHHELHQEGHPVPQQEPKSNTPNEPPCEPKPVQEPEVTLQPSAIPKAIVLKRRKID